MSSNKIKFGAMTCLLLAAIAVVMYQHQQIERLIGSAAQPEHTAAPTSSGEEIERLSGELRKAVARSENDARELARLRGQAVTLRQSEQENARLKAEVVRASARPPRAQPEADQSNNPWDQPFGAGSSKKMQSGMRWGLAVITHASEHQGQFPRSLAEAEPSLDKDLTGNEKTDTKMVADQFELLYHGFQEDITSPPPEGAIIVRSRPWQTPDGKWAKVYIYGNGVGMIHSEPDGNFEKWESIRIPKPRSQ